MEYLLHEKHACGRLFVGMFPLICMVNDGKVAAFSMRFFGILVTYLDRLVAT